MKRIRGSGAARLALAAALGAAVLAGVAWLAVRGSGGASPEAPRNAETGLHAAGPDDTPAVATDTAAAERAREGLVSDPRAARVAGGAPADLQADRSAILECSEALESAGLSPDYASTRDTDALEALAGVQRQLLDSADPEHLYGAALLDVEPAAGIRHMSEAVAHTRGGAVLTWHAVQTCSRIPDLSMCPLEELEARLLRLDEQNSEAWVRAAANRLRRGDEQGALAAMRRAGAAAESRIYWVETIEMTERLFAAASDLPRAARIAQAIGIASRNVPNFSDYTTMCVEESARSVEWAQACLAYGKLGEARPGMGEIGQLIGLAIQSIALAALGDDEGIRAAEARLEARRRAWGEEIYDPAGETVVTSMLWDPDVYSEYLSRVASDGELGARRALREQAPAWLRRHGLEACLPVVATAAAPSAREAAPP